MIRDKIGESTVPQLKEEFKLRRAIREEITSESLRNTIRKMVREMDFKDKESFEKYKSQHKMRSGTKVNIAGKETTVGATSGDKDSETGKDYTSKFTGTDEPAGSTQIEKTRNNLNKASDDQLEYIIDDQDIWGELEDWDIEPGKIPEDPAARAELTDAVYELVFKPIANDPDEFDFMTKSYLGKPEDDIYAYDPSTPDVEKHADTIMAITKDDVEFDGYDANDRPMFVSSDDPDLEYTVDKKGNIWRHDGFKDKVIGTTSAGADKSSVTPIDNDKGVKRMAASIEKKTNVSPGSLELQGRTKANDGTSIIQWKDKSDGTLMGISDDGSVYEGGKKTSYKADQDSFKESIMPQLKKEFKQYEFAQKSKNWKRITI